MITKAVNLWLGSGPRVVIPVSQFDTMWQFVFTIIKGGLEWTIPTGATAVLNGLKPDGNVFAFSGTISGNTVTVDCDVQMTAVAGDTICELSILADGKTVGTANFTLAVEAAPNSTGATPSASDLDAYGAIISGELDTYFEQHPEMIEGKGLSEPIRLAILNCFQHVAWANEPGDEYYNALYDLLMNKEVLSITAVFDQGSAVIYTSDTLDDLKQYLTVTAQYDDGTSGVVTGYTLSGTLTEGTSTITVSYSGKTDTFDVVVTRYVFYDYIYDSYTTDQYTTPSWVDTGLTYSPSFTTLNIEFAAENKNNSSGNSSAPLICANNTATSDTGNVVWYARINKAGFSAYNLGVAKQLSSVPGDTRAVIKYFFVDGGQSYMEWNGTVVNVATIAKSSVATNDRTLLLMGGYSFSKDEAYSHGGNGKIRLGYVKFTDPATNTLLYHFIPAYDSTTGKYGFYEDVNGVFYPDRDSYLRGGNWGV